MKASNPESLVLAMVYEGACPEMLGDQLNRLKQARGIVGLTTGNTWHGITDATADRYKSMYDFDANGNILHTQRWDNAGQQYDDMTYGYHEVGGNRVRNRLYHVKEEGDDLVVTDVGDYPEVPTDITDQDNAVLVPRETRNELPLLTLACFASVHFDRLGPLARLCRATPTRNPE